MNVWRAAADLARRGASGALATVARTRGSTPVPAGTKMLVGATGRLVGTVGGGCVEADVIRAGLEVQQAGQPALVTHTLNADLAGDLGLSCGGTVDVFVEPLVPDEAYIRVLEAAAGAESGLVTTATEWRAGPEKSFAALPESAAPAESATITQDRRFVIERLAPAPRVVVFGAGHVGSAIARVAHAAGFRVVVVDDRAEFADPARFPEMSVYVGTADDTLTRYPLRPADAVVIATRGHHQDALIVERVAVSSAGYVGLLGSRRKKLVVTKGLTAAGVPPEALERVRVPVGVPIGAVTPEEIAVSVVAELISWRRARETGHGKRDT